MQGSQQGECAPYVQRPAVASQPHCGCEPDPLLKLPHRGIPRCAQLHLRGFVGTFLVAYRQGLDTVYQLRCLHLDSGTAVGSVAFSWTSRPGTAGVVVGMLAELGFSVFVISPLVRLGLHWSGRLQVVP